MRGFNSIALLVIMAAACAPPASQESAELAARSNSWEEALNAGDIEALVALYHEDARIMPPNDETMRGREAAAAVFGGMIESGLKGELESLEAVVAADIGYNVGTYTLQGPDGSLVDRGKFIEVWRMVDGEWLMSNDIWNSDLPPAAAAGTMMAITHEVEDAARWLAAWRGPDSRHEMFAQHGAPEVSVFQSRDNPNLTGLLVQVTDMEAFEAFMATPDAAAAKTADGVKDATMHVFTEVK